MTRDAPNYEAYLAAKRTVDDRALNPRVWHRLANALRDHDGPLRVLDVGAGTGAMLPRLLRVDGVPDTVQYTALDRDPGLLAAIPPHLADATDLVVGSIDDGFSVTADAGRTAHVETVTADARAIPRRVPDTVDLVVAAGFMDLVDPSAVLPTLLDRLGPGGLAYFPITFDGDTALEPAPNPSFDARVLDRYHASMREEGSDRAGRALLRAIPDARARLLTVGGADWVVTPEDGAYPADEADFLRYLLDTIRRELAGHPDIDADRFSRWIRTRRRQVRDAELVLVAHNLDVLVERN